jgi:hypothetical protein
MAMLDREDWEWLARLPERCPDLWTSLCQQVRGLREAGTDVERVRLLEERFSPYILDLLAHAARVRDPSKSLNEILDRHETRAKRSEAQVRRHQGWRERLVRIFRRLLPKRWYDSEGRPTPEHLNALQRRDLLTWRRGASLSGNIAKVVKEVDLYREYETLHPTCRRLKSELKRIFNERNIPSPLDVSDWLREHPELNEVFELIARCSERAWGVWMDALRRVSETGVSPTGRESVFDMVIRIIIALEPRELAIIALASKHELHDYHSIATLRDDIVNGITLQWLEYATGEIILRKLHSPK